MTGKAVLHMIPVTMGEAQKPHLVSCTEITSPLSKYELYMLWTMAKQKTGLCVFCSTSIIHQITEITENMNVSAKKHRVSLVNIKQQYKMHSYIVMDSEPAF